jgi:hypothetical protein
MRVLLIEEDLPTTRRLASALRASGCVIDESGRGMRGSS